MEKLALFFYKTENDKPLVYQVPDVGTPAETTSTNYLYNIEVPESAGLTSGEWYLYAVANWDKGFWDKDMSIEGLAQMTKSEMDNYCIQKKYKTNCKSGYTCAAVSPRLYSILRMVRV